MRTFDSEGRIKTVLAGSAGGGGGLTEAQHEALRSLSHFIDDGPAETTFNNAYREDVGGAFVTSTTWYTSAAKTNKIVELVITRDASQKPTTEVWKVYDDVGGVVITVTDTITYTGVFESSRTRAIA